MSKNTEHEKAKELLNMRFAAKMHKQQLDALTAIESYNLLKQICEEFQLNFKKTLEYIDDEVELERQFNKKQV